MYVIYKSFYRCAKRNAEVSSTCSNGPHVPRKNGTAAADIVIFGAHALRMIDIARKHGVGGVGISQKGRPLSKSFFHIDMISDSTQPRPTMW